MWLKFWLLAKKEKKECLVTAETTASSKWIGCNFKPFYVFAVDFFSVLEKLSFSCLIETSQNSKYCINAFFTIKNWIFSQSKSH